MRTSSLLLSLGLSLLVCLASAYDESEATKFMKLSNMAYCDAPTLQNFNCTDCNDVASTVKFLHYYQQEADLGDSIAYSLFVDDDNQQFISAFRGTNTKWQLAIEGFEGTDVEYDLYDISDAMVTDYFYNRYTTYLRNDFLSNFESYASQYSGYTFVFTGHSLGAALTTHAALDAVLGGTVSGGQTIMYNYGSPRVGNYAFASKVVSTLSEIARVVHWQDLVPHVPFCSEDSSGNCQTE